MGRGRNPAGSGTTGSLEEAGEVNGGGLGEVVYSASVVVQGWSVQGRVPTSCGGWWVGGRLGRHLLISGLAGKVPE